MVICVIRPRPLLSLKSVKNCSTSGLIHLLSAIISVGLFAVLNNFMRKRVTAKSNDFKSLFGNEKHSKPQINTGMHFDLRNSKQTSSAAVLPILQLFAEAYDYKLLTKCRYVNRPFFAAVRLLCDPRMHDH